MYMYIESSIHEILNMTLLFESRFGHGCWVGFFLVFVLGANANRCSYMTQFKIGYMEFSIYRIYLKIGPG